MKCVLLSALLLACTKSPREKAQAIVDDKSLATSDALAEAAAVIYPGLAKAWTEGTRVFVIVERDEIPSYDRKEHAITFFRVLDGKRVAQDTSFMAVGHARGIDEVLVADRYHATVDGVAYTILEPRRTVRHGADGLQSFNAWEPADLEKAKPYDMLMGKRMGF